MTAKEILTPLTGYAKLKAPAAPANANFTLDPLRPNLVDISGGNITGTLPPANSLPVGHVILTRIQTAAATLGNTSLTISPGGAGPDTINQGGTKRLRLQGETCSLMTDGVSNWTEVGGQFGYSPAQVLSVVVTASTYNTQPRPTTRTDLCVIWICPSATQLATNAIPGDILLTPAV